MFKFAVLAGLALFVGTSATLADGDAAKGEKLFSRCVACHSVKDAANKTGPHLKGIIGRPVASVAGFKYSNQMLEYAKTAGTWDEAKIDAYLANPKAIVPGGKMALAPQKKEDEREDIIAYLKTIAP